MALGSHCERVDSGWGRLTKVHDLVIRSGTVVTATTKGVADVAIDSGKVTRLGGTPTGRSEINAAGFLVFPGGIDMHVHFTPMDVAPDAPRRPDDFRIGSRAAAAGGVTTIGNMTHQRHGEALLLALERDQAEGERGSLVDFVLHPVLNDPSPSAIAEILELPARGHPSLKLFMVFEDFEQRAEQYLDAMSKAASSGTLVLIHCEDRAMIRAVGRQLAAAGSDDPSFYGQSRPIAVEVAAVERAIAFAEVSGATMQVVHLSSEAALERCIAARRRGVNVHVETRPLYLHFTEEVFGRPDAAKYIGNPPPRGSRDRDRLWEGLAAGEVDTVASDHAPWTLEQKLSAGPALTGLLPGVADLETMLPMIFSEGVVTGRLTPNQFVAVTSANQAQLFGLSQTKGDVAVGADADLVVWDPEAKWVVDGGSMESGAGYSPYDGWQVQGRPLFTISRGDVILDPDGVLASPGRGRLVPRGPIASLHDADSRSSK